MIIVFYEEDESPEYVKSYFSDLIDGLIFISNCDHDQFIRPAEEKDIPYVVLCMDGVFSRQSPRPHSFDPALEECVKYCRENQLERIRYFSVENDGRFVNNKFPVFAELADSMYPECSLEHVVCPVKQRDFKYMEPFLQDYFAREHFDIAICQNYDIGLVVQKEILKQGFQIPQRTKNLFLNHVNFYEMTYPSISGIVIPYREMGTYAAQLIIAIVEGEEKHFQYQEFRCQLVHRDSTRI